MSSARAIRLIRNAASRALRTFVPVLLASSLTLTPGALLAQEEPKEPALPADTADALKRFRSGTMDVRTLAEVMPLMASTETRTIIRSAIVDSKEPPRGNLVSLLQHPSLAVRLGSLELLEEMCDGDFSYNPWLPADAPENIAAFERWKAWAGEPAEARKDSKLYSDDQRRAYLQDLLGPNADKASRARRMLEAEGLSAVGFLETFLKENATLAPGSRAAVREAQYQITLTRNLGDQAAITARHLAFGSRDQLLTALSTIRACGRLSLPILRDFINHPDPLVRETAIDSLLITGGEQAVAVVAPMLESEPDVNVIHGALRRLKDIPCSGTDKLLGAFLARSDEDLLVSAIQTAISVHNKGNSSMMEFSGKPKKGAGSAVGGAVVQLLKSEHWRVRAVALEYVTKAKNEAAKDSCVALLDDPDEFVRFAAIAAVSAIGAKEAVPKLKSMLMSDESSIGPVVFGLQQLGASPDDSVIKRLLTAKPETKLAVLRSMNSETKLTDLLYSFAADGDIDVSCTALRLIASDDDLYSTRQGSGALVGALRSNTTEKREAVLERLHLSSPQNVDPSILMALETRDLAAEKTSLDPLYDAFLLPGADATSAKPAAGPVLTASQKDLFAELTRLTTMDHAPGDRFRAALNLARAGNPNGFAALIRDLPSLNTAQKITIGESLYNPSHRDAIKLLLPLMADPVAEVRGAAAGSALSNDNARALIESVLNELLRPGALLKPIDVYGSRFDSAMKESGNAKLMRNWCLKVIGSDQSPPDLVVLAVIAARNTTNPSILDALRGLTKSKDRNVRRAAWHSLFTARPSEISVSAAAVAADPEAFVRETLPNRAAVQSRTTWSHRFSDSHVTADERWSYNETKPRLTPEARDILRNLATKDPSKLIRFEASYALLSHGALTNLDELIALIPQLPKETKAQERLADWLSSNAQRATPALAPLFQAIDTTRIDADDLAKLMARINPDSGKGFATFASLAESAGKETNQPLLEPEKVVEKPAPRTSLEIVYFQKPGCPECLKARQEIQRLTKEFPLIKLTEYSILDPKGTVLNQALCGRFSVPSTKQSVSPAIFTQSGFLITDQITPKNLAELLAKTMDSAQDDSWFQVSEAQTAAAATQVEERYLSLTPAVVILGGLLDGVNPCAFATIIFFLSYLQISRRTPREMLMVGASFILAVFLAYLAAGLLLHEVIDTLSSRFAGVQRWMNLGFGLLALLAAFLSFRDAWLARGGRLDEMTLQLPGFLKSRIRSVIRTGAKARNFVIAAFVSGLVISLLELACTGQVYAPIIYQIRQGKLDAVLWLVIYNLAFITPLIVIFLLAYGGLRSEKLIAIQQKHTTSVKIGLGLLFLGLALVILLTSGK
jgi:HEAT repeat protein/cytochrome c biogenesis protein CcdA